MPNKTFFNLPEQKRQRIEEFAAEEFAKYGYQAFSITKIVKRTGIAKGSFYQYFKDKHDLFLHLVTLAEEEKMLFFKNRQPSKQENKDLFAYLRWLLKEGLEYASVKSQLNQAVSRVILGEGFFLDESFKKMRKASSRMFTEMFEQAYKNEIIENKIHPSVAAFIVEVIFNSLGLFILNQQKINQEDLVQNSIDWLCSEKSKQIIEEILYVLENGMRKKTEK